MADSSGLSDYCWVDLITDGDDILELANNLGGLEGHNGDEPRLHLKVREGGAFPCDTSNGVIAHEQDWEWQR